MRVPVVVRLEPVETVRVLEVLDDRIGHVAHVAMAERPEPIEEDAGVIDRRDDREPERLAELEVLGAAAGRDVDDASALVLADLDPGHDAVLVAVLLERRPDHR